jgi:hypothetical protein
MISRSLLIATLCAILGLPRALLADGPLSPANLQGLPEILRDALMTEAADAGRWAYTETTQMKASIGNPRGETVVRFDPSRPYEEQFTPLKINGREPTEKQRDMYRRRGEQRRKKLEPAAPAQDPAINAPRATVGGKKVTIDLEHVAIVAEDATSLTYELPFKANEKVDVPVDKFQLLVRVNRERRVLENVEFKLKESFRVKAIIKLSAMEFHMDFTTIDPKFAPQMTSLSGSAAGGLLFIKINLTTDSKRTDFQRVTPFNERFGVKIGPVKVLEFLE